MAGGSLRERIYEKTKNDTHEPVNRPSDLTSLGYAPSTISSLSTTYVPYVQTCTHLEEFVNLRECEHEPDACLESIGQFLDNEVEDADTARIIFPWIDCSAVLGFEALPRIHSSVKRSGLPGRTLESHL